MPKTGEQRKHKRFRPGIGAFVLLGPDSTKLGRIIDVSLGGLAFSHMASARPPNELSELDMFLIDADFYLEKLPYTIVSDFQTFDNPFGSITMRRCCVQFGELTQHQKSQVAHFVQDYTEDGVWDVEQNR